MGQEGVSIKRLENLFVEVSESGSELPFYWSIVFVRDYDLFQ